MNDLPIEPYHKYRDIKISSRLPLNIDWKLVIWQITQKYGSDLLAAEALGISVGIIRHIRYGKIKMPSYTDGVILLNALLEHLQASVEVDWPTLTREVLSECGSYHQMRCAYNVDERTIKKLLDGKITPRYKLGVRLLNKDCY